jgi:hypothetical protein
VTARLSRRGPGTPARRAPLPAHTSTFLWQIRRFDAEPYDLRTARRAAVPAEATG